MNPAREFEFERGLVAIRKTRLVEAEQWFTRALRAEPGWHEALQRRAYVRERRGRLSEAARDYRTSLAGTPECKECLEGAADVAVKRGRRGEAEGFLDQAIKLDPANSSFRYDRGCVRLSRRRLQEAVEDFSRVVSFCQEGRRMIALVGRAQARALMGDLRTALEDLDRAVLMRSGVRENHFCRGVVRFLSKDLKGAAEDFRSAHAPKNLIRELMKSSTKAKRLLIAEG